MLKDWNNDWHKSPERLPILKTDLDYSRKNKKLFDIRKRILIDQFKKKCLIEGLDDIDLSMKKVEQIDNYEKIINTNKPWMLRNE